MSPKDVLQAARDLITDPHNWTLRAMARNAEGRRREPGADDAVCWCVAGAIERVLADHAIPIWDISDYVTYDTRDALVAVNDVQGHAAVLAELDRLIAQATP